MTNEEWPHYGHNPGNPSGMCGPYRAPCEGNCDGVCEGEARRLLNVEIAELNETIEFAKGYTGYEGRACPLCEYKDGVFIKNCGPHTETANLQKSIAHIEALEVEYHDTIHRLDTEVEALKVSLEWHEGLCDRLREALSIESDGQIIGQVLTIVRDHPTPVAGTSSDGPLKTERLPYDYTPRNIESLEADLLNQGLESKKTQDMIEVLFNRLVKDCGCFPETETDPEDLCPFHSLLG